MSEEAVQVQSTETPVEAAAPAAAPAPQPPASNEPEWWIDDKTPGVGKRPEWMKSNFKRISDIEKSREELEKKLGAFTGAPEDDYDIKDLELDEDDFLVQELKAFGKEANMNETMFKKLLGRFQAAAETESERTIVEEVKKLGADGERQLKEFEQWTKNYFKPEKAEIIKEMITSAERLSVFNEIMANTHMSAVPTSQSMALANKHESVAELRAELTKNIDKFDTDKNYASNWQKRMEYAVARENR